MTGVDSYNHRLDTKALYRNYRVSMKTLISHIGKGIRIFNRRIALTLTLLLAFLPTLVCALIYWYFNVTAVSVWVIAIVSITEFFWVLNCGIWWDEMFPRYTRTNMKSLNDSYFLH